MIVSTKRVVVTYGGDGAALFESGVRVAAAPAVKTEVVNTVGAGDAFFSFASVCFALNLSQEILSFVGNTAGALKVQIQGNRKPA